MPCTLLRAHSASGRANRAATRRSKTDDGWKCAGRRKRKLVNVTCRAISRRLDLLEKVPIEHAYDIFAGPKKPAVLSSFGIPGSAMDDLIYFGWFGWVARPMIAVLHGIHAVLGNYGIAIILLTVFVRGAMFPISRKQAISSQKMQELQPEMKIITEKYKNEPEKRTRATQELWKNTTTTQLVAAYLCFSKFQFLWGSIDRLQRM